MCRLTVTISWNTSMNLTCLWFHDLYSVSLLWVHSTNHSVRFLAVPTTVPYFHLFIIFHLLVNLHGHLYSFVNDPSLYIRCRLHKNVNVLWEFPVVNLHHIYASICMHMWIYSIYKTTLLDCKFRSLGLYQGNLNNNTSKLVCVVI
jgi:hypothetical protein